MPKYILHYFDFTGKAEAIRVLFHHANVEFEDRRLNRAEWPELKKDAKIYPFGQVPVLEVDGEVLAQSDAIIIYLANEFGLNGKTNMEKAKNHMICAGIGDLFSSLGSTVMEKDPEKKAALQKAFIEEKLANTLKTFEETFAPKKGFFFGDYVSMSDIQFMTFMNVVGTIMKLPEGGCLDKFPLLKALHGRVEESPNIKKYLDSKK